MFSAEDRQLSKLTRFIFHAKHRGSQFAPGGRSVTCTIKDDTIFNWFNNGDKVLYSLVHPSEEMATPEGTGTLKRGVIELQPGILHTHSGGAPDEEEEESKGPSSFSINTAAVGDATPLFRYSLALDAAPKSKKRKRDNEGGGPSGHLVGSRRRNSAGGGGSNTANGGNGNGSLSQPVKVMFCSEDGSLRVSTKLNHGFECPFESCGLRCRHSITFLQHHLTASHPYYEYFVTAGEEGPEVWARCRRGRTLYLI